MRSPGPPVWRPWAPPGKGVIEVEGVGIRRVLLHEDAADSSLARTACDRLKKVPSRIVFEDRAGGEGKGEPGRIDLDKETLRLVAFPGEMLKPCPGTGEGYICCGYQILNVGVNCPLDCSYCILQAYINQPSLRVFANLPRALSGLADRIDRDPSRFWRIGTGEFTDSLALDPVVGWTDLLLPFMEGRRNAILELKTKTVRIEGLLASRTRDRIVVSWSLNSPRIVSREEHRAPSLEKRLRAAARCQEEGFAVGFHFDPLVRHPGWKEGYERTVELLDRWIAPKKVIWISLGAMRFMPGLKPIIRRRHPGSEVLRGEFVPGTDGKLRYFKPMRTEMYAHLRELLTAWHPDPGLYLCMERDDVWLDAMGWSPGTSKGLSDYLDERARTTFSIIG